MKTRVRILISVAALAALAALCALIHASTARERSLRTCEGIRLEYADDYRFVTEEDIKGSPYLKPKPTPPTTAC